MGVPTLERNTRFFLDANRTSQLFLYDGRPTRLTPPPAAGFCNSCNADKPNEWVGQKCLDCGAWVYQKPTAPEINAEYVMRRYPRLVAHVIAGSLGYATPSCAARIIADAIKGHRNHCEWVAGCYRGDAKACVAHQIRWRRTHRGYMASYAQALVLVATALAGGREPEFASWF